MEGKKEKEFPQVLWGKAFYSTIVIKGVIMMQKFVLTFIVVFLIAVNGGYAFRENIVGAWLFDEDSGKVAKDYSGNGNDGEIKGKPERLKGVFKTALRFDGSTYVEIPFSKSLWVLNKGDFTLAAWFYSEKLPPPEWVECVFQQGDKNGTGRSWLFIEQGAANEINSFLGGATTHSGVKVEEERKWYHAALAVKEGGAQDQSQIYVNGKVEAGPNTISVEDSEGNYFIGAHKAIKGFFIGVIDEVVLINKALSEKEVKELMEKGVMGMLSVKRKGKLSTCWGSLKAYPMRILVRK